MSVGSQVADVMRKLSEGRFEDAVVAVSVALSATARLEYPTDGDKAACRKFLEQNLPIISDRLASFGVSQPINFRYRRLDSRASGISVRTRPEMLYDVVRCTALHEAGLPANLHVTLPPPNSAHGTSNPRTTPGSLGARLERGARDRRQGELAQPCCRVGDGGQVQVAGSVLLSASSGVTVSQDRTCPSASRSSDRSSHHLFQPLLYQVAMARLSPADIAVPIRHGCCSPR